MQQQAPIFDVVRSSRRAFYDHGWLKTYHSFSFADYVDPRNTNWGVLRVFNDDRVAPGEGFPPHPHRDMEIVTYVLAGELEHQDSMGNRGVVGPGSVQYMSAGTGVRHAEYNHSKDRELHFIQMWVLPERRGLPPRYGQRDFAEAERRNRWLQVASGAAHVAAPIALAQSAALSVAKLECSRLSYDFADSRLAFLFIADGAVRANDTELSAGDAVRIASMRSLALEGTGELVLWDLAALDTDND